MAELCSSFPTLTSTQEVRTQTVLTTVSNGISTIPASVFSVTTTAACGNSSCPPVIVRTESPARTVTIRVPVTLTSQINTFVVSTLWGTTCTRSDGGLQSPTPTSISTPSLDRTASPPPTFTPAGTLSSSTSLILGHLSAEPGSGASFSTTPSAASLSQTSVITPIPTDLLPTTTTTTTTTTLDSGQNQNSDRGTIVGGVIGGVICLSVLAVIIWHLLRKRRDRINDRLGIVFEKVTPPSRQYQQFNDKGSNSSRQPFGGQQLGEQWPAENPWHQD